MPRSCSICRHPERQEIDTALVDQASYRAVVGRFPDTSTSALQRHAVSHLPVFLAQARDAREVASADDLLAQIEHLRDRAMGILTRAEQGEDLRAAVSAIKEARGCVELLAKMMGELREGNQVNIMISPEWGRARGVIVAALAEYPDARQSVALALEEIDGDRA